tara:strand:+ start:1016 stop:1582 length:567 start_codon:yes stop_codon:yes gene_type:complete
MDLDPARPPLDQERGKNRKSCPGSLQTPDQPSQVVQAEYGPDSMPKQLEQPALRPGAAVLAWILPGLGHIAIGQHRRGLMMMFGILFLFVFGVLIGGVDVVDMKRDRLWFLAQGCNGPIAFLVDYLNQTLLKTAAPATQARLTSLGNINATGTLFIALGGLMNFILILDALGGPDRGSDHPGRRSTDP